MQGKGRSLEGESNNAISHSYVCLIILLGLPKSGLCVPALFIAISLAELPEFFQYIIYYFHLCFWRVRLVPGRSTPKGRMQGQIRRKDEDLDVLRKISSI